MAQKQLQITYKNAPFSKFPNVKSSTIKIYCTNEACLSTMEDLWEDEIVTFGESSSDRTIEEDLKVLVNHVYKNYNNNMLYCYDMELIPCYIKESQTQFTWEVGNEHKQIMGYNCTKAKTHFRGREYTAWFTTELPFKAAPWKFHGLPGVMLEVKSKNSYVLMEAIDLKITEGDTPKNPFKNKALIAWDDFSKLYKKQIDKNQKQLMANQAKLGLSTDFQIKRPRVEVIVDANQ